MHMNGKQIFFPTFFCCFIFAFLGWWGRFFFFGKSLKSQKDRVFHEACLSKTPLCPNENGWGGPFHI